MEAALAVRSWRKLLDPKALIFRYSVNASAIVPLRIDSVAVVLYKLVLLLKTSGSLCAPFPR